MKTYPRLHLDTARKLINFYGKSDAATSFAELQLKGSVALYNMLISQKFAYLADEVGMGKTYVAIGVVALLKHFNPNARILYLTPRKNIQLKWIKEIRNFSDNNWIVTDHRVRSFNKSLIVPVVINRLRDLVSEVIYNSRRDFIMRMSSFSLPSKTKDRFENIKHFIDDVPWINIKQSKIKQCEKDELKDIYGCAMNRLLPTFDLVIIDEGHNLKHGYGDYVSSRNRVLGLSFGKKPDENLNWIPWSNEKRAKMALILSATPLEYDYKHLWNQMDIVGFGEHASKLCDPDVNDEEKKKIASQYLLRRLTKLNVKNNGKIEEYTKNMYRREWRGGGIDQHDYPLTLKNDIKQRLVVALIQKKVAEIMEDRGRHSGRKFSRSFQIGMLSSFESFFQTAKLKDKEHSNFDQSDQTDDNEEKEGIDTPTVNKISDSYRRKFSSLIPHPKMDAVSDEAFAAMKNGEKTLIFVRRIGSVKELSQKICEKYDEWIKEYISTRLSENIRNPFENKYKLYQEEKHKQKRTAPTSNVIELSDKDEDKSDQENLVKDDEGGLDSFFSWFFRGEPNKEYITARNFRKNRLESRNSPYFLIFEDNHIKYLLGENKDLIESIALTIGLNRDKCGKKLRELAYNIILNSDRKSADYQKYYTYNAYQQAALTFLTKSNDTALSQCAKIILNTCYVNTPLQIHVKPPSQFPDPDEYLDTKTFFTELAKEDTLCRDIWTGRIHDYIKKPVPEKLIKWFREREERRILVSSAIKLGHPLIDLWILAVNQIGSIEMTRKSDAGETVQQLMNEFIRILNEQRASNQLTSYRELRRIAENFNLIKDVNFHDISEKLVYNLKEYIADTMGKQFPIAGMHGGVTPKIVKQFRMPGYPYILVSTDILQEGEDLHTFCRRIHHYGISYTPSAMEQRTGRIDRIGSMTSRLLSEIEEIEEEYKLQVYYPYLQDTYEIVQAHEVFKRMNKFVTLMHDKLTAGDEYSSNAQINTHLLHGDPRITPIEGKLESPFDVREDQIQGDLCVIINIPDNESICNHFNNLLDGVSNFFKVDWDDNDVIDQYPIQRLGTFYIFNGKIVKADEKVEVFRKQPASIHLKSIGDGTLIIKIISPIGTVDYNTDDVKTIYKLQQSYQSAKICSIADENYDKYNLTVENSFFFGVDTLQIDEVLSMIEKTIITADILEYELLKTDKKLMDFMPIIQQEAYHE